MERQLTEGRPFGVLLRYALPVLGGNLFQLFYTLADTVIVGKTLGADALAAVGSTGIISYFVLCFVQGLTGGFGICLGQCCGAGDETGMRRSAAVSWTLSAVFTLLLTPLVCLLARPVLGWMQTPEDIFADAYAYLFVILLGTGATVFYNIISYMLRALGDSRTPLVFLVLSSLLNIGLDILFIVPFHMGVAGAAYATILGQWIAAAIGLVMNIRKNPEVSISMKGFRPHGATIRRILSIGIPSVVMQSIGSIMTFLMNQILIAFSATAVAVFGVYFKLQSFVFMPVFGLNNGTVPIVAYNFGARRGDRMRQTIKYSICAAVAIMIVGMLMFQSVPDKLLRLFDASEEMLRLGVPALRIISISFPLAGFGIGAGSVFQALGYSVYSMIISLIRQLVVLIPCAYAIGRMTGDVTGVWWAFVIAELVSLTASALYLRRVNRDVIRTL